jgi:hypothetical protein
MAIGTNTARAAEAAPVHQTMEALGRAVSGVYVRHLILVHITEVWVWDGSSVIAVGVLEVANLLCVGPPQIPLLGLVHNLNSIMTL